MIAFHFPPLAGSSGVQRTLRFVQYLPRLGWQPTVLSASPAAYERTSTDLVGSIPSDVSVVRAFALDAARHLSVGGRYPAFLGRPDRWQSWRLAATLRGLRLLREQPFDALWSTYPIATAHRIAATLHRRSGLPWIADFRDPMAQDGYPADPRTWKSFQRIEETVLGNASCSVFTTPGAARHYRDRYPAIPAERIAIVENGYDEGAFVTAESRLGQLDRPRDRRITLLHSGIVYPSERDPTQLFEALASLKAAGTIAAENFCLQLRASENDEMLRRLADAAGIADLIRTDPPIPYCDALEEMLRVDALLVMQASNCNAQVPAKIYEYLRAGRPILALTDPDGDTAKALSDAGVREMARLDSAVEIASLIGRFLASRQAPENWSPSAEAARLASREARTTQLADILDRVCASTDAGRRIRY